MDLMTIGLNAMNATNGTGTSTGESIAIVVVCCILPAAMIFLFVLLFFLGILSKLGFRKKKKNNQHFGSTIVSQKTGDNVININVNESILNKEKKDEMNSIKCYSCGGPVNRKEIVWTSTNTFECPYCGSTNRR